jgi:large subunit ribosomal protein L22
VNKGPIRSRKIEPRGRGHVGVRLRPSAKMKVVLREGKTVEEKKEKERRRKLDRIRSAFLLQEHRPIRNPSSTWTW